MADWTARLRVRVSKALSTDDTSITFDFEGHSCSVSASPRDGPLKDSKWWTFSSAGFTTKDAAEAFGRRLGRALRFAALCREVGVDFGLDRASGWFSDYVVQAVADSGGRLMPNVHGLLVYEREGTELFLGMEGNARVLMDPSLMISALQDAVSVNLEWDDRLAAAVDLVVLSKMATEPLSEAALAISAIEHLANETPWTVEQMALLESLEATARQNTELQREEVEEVAKAIKQSFKSIRQSIRTKLKSLGFGNEDLKEFDKIYGLRSGVFHGSNLDRGQYQSLANDARNFCTKVVIAAIRVGVPLV